MENEYTDNIVEHAFYGIDENIPADRTTVVNLRDLMKVHATLAELIQFFHQPLHMQSLEDVEKYLGTFETNGAYKLMSLAHHDIMSRMLPSDMEALFEGSAFEAPNSPHYFEE
ncbi:hypothetical protein [Sulfitobacter mediterraneus]|jgi:hypothetical protein|uniref:Uncharacterized protein n=1 Tax=Sulfitobacter mediterraneus TaxID=83219 RepID=A0A2T6CHA2_9RHOB|nr:hypothetical protein [Sulfitobacter mediterraneus]PTX74870.1 hypothetical protein C8N31_103353 [Sulfitobacter mediterraneus]